MMAFLQIFRLVLSFATFRRFHWNSNEVSYLPWQNKRERARERKREREREREREKQKVLKKEHRNRILEVAKNFFANFANFYQIHEIKYTRNIMCDQIREILYTRNKFQQF